MPGPLSAVPRGLGGGRVAAHLQPDCDGGGVLPGGSWASRSGQAGGVSTVNSSLLNFQWPWMFLWHFKKNFKLIILNQDILWKWSKTAFDKMQLPCPCSTGAAALAVFPVCGSVSSGLRLASLRLGLRECR